MLQYHHGPVLSRRSLRPLSSVVNPSLNEIEIEIYLTEGE